MSVDIIAQRGNGAFLLIETRPTMGQVWEREGNRLNPEQSVEAILKFGYWSDYDGDEDADAIVKGADQ